MVSRRWKRLSTMEAPLAGSVAQPGGRCWSMMRDDGRRGLRRWLARLALVARCCRRESFSCGGGAAAGRRSGDAPTMS
ncbi:hypothetical protein F511_47581 [Dorcoceras hygrometricum]|uniref:Uncharacterized protein n=1 Tax=Dorcoceras hygrometricum TaxID=472368 RepID=A0A2Z6ZQP1_9LAMI|nr:hypothetical protein F511_47581 [Dorcoceras hygrometricum]